MITIFRKGTLVVTLYLTSFSLFPMEIPMPVTPYHLKGFVDQEALTALVNDIKVRKGDPRLNDRDEDGLTLLHHAALRGYTDIVQALVEADALLDIPVQQDPGSFQHYVLATQGSTPLHLAVRQNHRNVMDLLLDAGATVNCVNGDHESPLHGAAEHGNLAVINLLLQQGARPNDVDKNGRTPLHKALACPNPQIEIVRSLLAAGADPSAISALGETPLFLISSSPVLLWTARQITHELIFYGAHPRVPEVTRESFDPTQASRFSTVVDVDHTGSRQFQINHIIQESFNDPFLRALIYEEDDQALHFLAERRTEQETLTFAPDRTRQKQRYSENFRDALAVAASKGNSTIAKVLLAAGALPNSDIINRIQSIISHRRMTTDRRNNYRAILNMLLEALPPVRSNVALAEISLDRRSVIPLNELADSMQHIDT